VAIGEGIGFGARLDGCEKGLDAVLWFDLGEGGAVCAEVAKERRVKGSDTLADDGDAEPLDGQRLHAEGGLETVAIAGGGSAEGVHLMGGPEVGGFLFDEQGRLVDPVEVLEAGGKGDAEKTSKPILELCW
jgi:hypothetical protein